MDNQQPITTETSQKPKQHHVGKSRRELTSRAKTVVLSLLEGENTTQALLNAGYSKGYAVNHKESILANPIMQRTFIRVLEAAGVTDEKLADKIRTLIDAKEIKFFSHQGEVTDEREVEALDIQSNMVQFAAKLKGHVIDRSASLNVSVVCSPVDLARYSNRVDKPADNTVIEAVINSGTAK